MSGVHRWVRLDTSFPYNPKILALAASRRHRAIAVYCCALAYAGHQGTDGWIPTDALPLLHGRPKDAAWLTEVSLFVVRPGGWQIHDWDDYQPSSEHVRARTSRAQAAAMARWTHA